MLSAGKAIINVLDLIVEDDCNAKHKRKQEMTDEKFIKQAKQRIIEKEFEHISHKDSEKPEDRIQTGSWHDAGGVAEKRKTIILARF